MREPVRILLLCANPSNTARLRLSQEVRRIKDALEYRARVPFELRHYENVRSADLRFEILSYKPHFVHFSGHGGESGIVLEGDDGVAHLATAEALESFFEIFKKHIQCVLLDRCFSLHQAEAIARHIPFVIGTQKEISDKAAISFSVAFYEAIGQTEKVPAAFQYGIAALQLENIFSESVAPVLIRAAELRGFSPASEPVRGRLRVRRLVLENVRCFESLDLAVDDGTGWITVLGDNAAGKSTVLRSLALGLCNESDATALMSTLPGSLVREGAGSGSIQIELHDTEEDRTLSVVTRLIRDESTGEEILRKETDPAPFPWNKFFVCGYGTNRGRQAHAGFEAYTVRDAVRTLFDDDASLQNPELVLLRQRPELRQEIEKKVLQILMLNEPGYEVTYPKTGAAIQGPWGLQALRVLSDGYRSTMQWVLDFIGWGVYAGRFNGGRELGGILLIDELEQHLHPIWQRHIVDRLRRQFPATQIFATTHTPLLAAASADFEDALVCRLKAHLDGPPELVIIERQELAGLRADQVLTSEAFGLVTSRSLGSESDLDRFAELRGKAEPTAEEEAEIKLLSERLDQSLRFGERPFEQEVEAAVDKTLREMNTSADPELLDLETRRQLRELFRSEPDA